ncbi:MAG: glutaredoxin-like protein [Firmicutes bacterium]|nr:glutaredoxin-like protein [Bacillota bacterium]
MEAKMVLYYLESCQECRTIREMLGQLGLTYVCVNVSADKTKRPEVYRVSGQNAVPVLVDGEIVMNTQDNILEYLVERYSHNPVRPVKY